jgi:predicted nucleic acid-binding protein
LIICDTSGLIAAYDQTDPEGQAVRDLLEDEAGSLIVSPFVLAEVDYMIMTRSGAEAELVLLNDLSDGVYQVAAFTALDAERVVALAQQYTDLKLGIADAHTMCLTRADRYDTRRILTFDHRHFRAVKPPQGGVFTVLPADL